MLIKRMFKVCKKKNLKMSAIRYKKTTRFCTIDSEHLLENSLV